MKIEYEPRLIEKAVFLACRREPGLESMLHDATDPIYRTPDRRAAEAKFRDVYASFFTRLELGAPLSRLLAEHPLIEGHVGRCVVREAARRKDESADLFVKTSGQPALQRQTTSADSTLIMQVCPESLLHSERLAVWLRRELLHVSDMVDERFAYRREALDGLPARQNLQRDRYRVLWDIFVQGRLARRGHAEPSHTARLYAMFRRVFGSPPAESDAAFERVFLDDHLTHPQLIRWAIEPPTLFRSDSGGSRTSKRPNEGAVCPLCGFPTFDWFRFDADADSISQAIRTSFPTWQPDRGACRQCAEVYAAVGKEAGGHRSCGGPG